MLKVGDKARIIGNTNAHGFMIGEIVTIEKVNNGYRAKNNSESWWISKNEFELVNKERDLTSNTVITHEIATVDEKGYVKQQIDLTHQEYLSLKELFNDVAINEKQEDLNYLRDMLFGGK